MSDPIVTQTKQIIMNIYDYLQKQSKDVDSIENQQNITDLNKYISEITGLSEFSIKRIISERKHLQMQLRQKKKIIVLENSDLDMIKEIVNKYSEKENKLPKLRNLKYALSEENILDCKMKDLSTLLHNLGFDYTKYDCSKFDMKFDEEGQRELRRYVLQECESSSQDESENSA